MADPAITGEQRRGGSDDSLRFSENLAPKRAGFSYYRGMSVNEILAQLTMLEPAQLLKVRKTVDMLLGGTEEAPDTWPGHVWAALRKSFAQRGLRLPHYSVVQSAPDKKRKLADGADAIRDFLAKATGETDEHRLRVSLPFVVETSVRRLARGNAPMSASVVLNRLVDFPAYMVNAFPGCSSSPRQFSMVRALFSKSDPVS